ASRADLAHDGLHTGEEQVAVELVDLGLVAVLFEHSPVGHRALQRRRHLQDVVRVADRAAGAASDVHRVQFEVAGEQPAGLERANAVAAPVQPGRERRDGDLAGQYGYDAAADAALGRHAHFGEPGAGGV